MNIDAEFISKIAKKVGTDFLNGDAWGAVGSRILDSNAAINDVAKDSQGIAGTILRTMSGEKPVEAIKHAYTNNGEGLNIGAIAGSYLGVSSAYRIASGGGVYRDKNGNTNLIGVPFI